MSKMEIFLKVLVACLVLIYSQVSLGDNLLDSAYLAICSGDIQSGKKMIDRHLVDHPLDYRAHTLRSYFVPNDIAQNTSKTLANLDAGIPPRTDIARLDYAHALLSARPELYQQAAHYLSFSSADDEIEAERLMLSSSVKALKGDRIGALQDLVQSFLKDSQSPDILFFLIFESRDSMLFLNVTQALQKKVATIQDPLFSEFARVLLQYFEGRQEIDLLVGPLKKIYRRCQIDMRYAPLYGETLLMLDKNQEAVDVLKDVQKNLVFADPYRNTLYAIALFRTGNLAEAKAQFENILNSLKLPSEDDVASEAKKYLQQIKAIEDEQRNHKIVWSLFFFSVLTISVVYALKIRKK